ncbi:MAG: hypothetical protein IKW19_05935 [Akkermansia sp.]|nr:hypothetical protein [Akkermansia sp.]
MSNFILQTLSRFGYTPESFAREAESKGIGNAAQIQAALTKGDVSAFSTYGNQVRANNPQAEAQARAAMQAK